MVGDLARDCVRLEISEGIEGLRTLEAHFLAVGGRRHRAPGRSCSTSTAAPSTSAAHLKVALGADDAAAVRLRRARLGASSRCSATASRRPSCVLAEDA